MKVNIKEGDKLDGKIITSNDGGERILYLSGIKLK
jgi:hypothetical protein